MLQDFPKEGPHSLANKGPLALGVSLSFQCNDEIALYDEFRAKGLSPSEPFVGNHRWVFPLNDPDGYRVEFESPTDVLEEVKFPTGGRNSTVTADCALGSQPKVANSRT